MSAIRCTLCYKERDTWIRVMGSFPSLRQAREHTRLIGARTYKIHRLKARRHAEGVGATRRTNE